MKISKLFIQESIIVLTILMLTLSNGLLKRPILILFFSTMVYFCVSKISNIRFAKDLIKKSWPLLIVYLWCFISVTWSPWPQKTLYELGWQMIVYIYVILFIITLLRVDNTKVVRFITVSWVILTTFLVLSLDVVHGRVLEVTGAFYSKNNLGPVIGMMVFYFLFAIKRWDIVNIGIISLVVILLVMTFSKTSIAVTFIILCVSSILNNKRWQALPAASRFFLFSPVRIALWIAAIVVPVLLAINYNWIFDILYSNLEDDWLTGRGRLWIVMLNQSFGHLLYGMGYASVWGVGDYNVIQDTILAKYAAEWVDKLAASDGGYIDMFIAIGSVGVGLFAHLIFDFYKTYFRIVSLGKTDKFTSLAFCIGTFAVINNITETTFLLAASFSWFNFILAYLLLKTKILIDVEKKYE